MYERTRVKNTALKYKDLLYANLEDRLNTVVRFNKDSDLICVCMKRVFVI